MNAFRLRRLRAVDICREYCISRETWRQWRKSGAAPDPNPNLSSANRWREADIAVFFDGQARDGERVGLRYFTRRLGARLNPNAGLHWRS
jgi:hypothetical protein